MSGHRKTLAFALLLVMSTVASTMGATPIEPTAKELIREVQRPPVPFVPARIGWETARKPAGNFSLTFEQYGPQATARAVRASLRTALVPDPLAMAALLLCAFALRWMRIRREQAQPGAPEIAITDVALPRAA